MKKSYDYFKTLKILSETVSIIYQKTLLKQDFSSERLMFFAEKSELLNNLRNEFITPFERGDIFLLEESLEEELNSIYFFQEYFSLINNSSFEIFESMKNSLKTQALVFSQLNNFKSNLKLFEICSDEVKCLNTGKKNIEKSIVDALKCKTEQPLIKYVTCSAFLDLNRKTYNTILQIERILIDNS